MRKYIAVAALLLILLAVNWSIYSKEKHLHNGKVVFLELAPVDPRSLMQGDYMDLRFELADAIRDQRRLQQPREPGGNTGNGLPQTASFDGYVIVTLDDRNVGSFHSLDEHARLAENQLRIQYRVRRNQIKFATNAFFFQEGHAAHFESAQYGKFKVNSDGEPLLTDLYNGELIKIEPEATL